MEVSSNFTPAALPEEKPPGSHWIWGSVNPTAGVDYRSRKSPTIIKLVISATSRKVANGQTVNEFPIMCSFCSLRVRNTRSGMPEDATQGVDTGFTSNRLENTSLATKQLPCCILRPWWCHKTFTLRYVTNHVFIEKNAQVKKPAYNGIPRNWTILLVSDMIKNIKNTKLRGFGPQANYTDRATAASRRS
jgi:hypothetical protein